MKALGKLKKEPGIWMFDAEKPSIKPDEVLIKIKKTAICGTDVHIYNWDEWAQKVIPVPIISGHEYVGEIVEIGNVVTGFKIGQRVSGEGHVTCGNCRNCRSGRFHFCADRVSVGVTRNGAFAEYLAIPARNAFPIPDDISDEIASIFDPFGNATHTALAFDLVGEDVLITGAGPIGIMAAAIAKHVGARHVVITDINDQRLELAKKVNPTRVVNPMRESLKDVMKDLKMTEGFDVGLEMSGNPKAFNDMLNSMVYGGKVALLGFLPPETQIDWNKIIMKGLTIKGIYGRQRFDTWYKMVTMLQSGLDISAIITHHFPVSEFQKGFDVMCGGQSGKVILHWDK